jgi:indoleamine 2,3-dioxygenase
MVLAWLVHFFIHSIPRSGDEATADEEAESLLHIPEPLAVPLVAISNTLSIAPVLTFADTVLWNWELIRPDLPTSIENMQFINLFSTTEDEYNFYVASARAELRGADVLHIIEDYHCLRDVTDLTWISKMARDLTRLAGIIDDISDIIQSVRGTCDPHVFYWAIRPWYEGSDPHGEAKRWIYEGVPHSKDLDLSGPSGGQSSLMHALDIFLDVDHKLQQRRQPPPSESNQKAETGFMERMRRYMPGKHREYLTRLVAMPRSLRELALETPMLQEPYDAAVLALKKLRDSHMRIACRYIVTMSRSNPSVRPGCPVSAMLDRMQREQKGTIRGTGGNELCVLLKAGRDATRRTLIRKNAGEER